MNSIKLFNFSIKLIHFFALISLTRNQYYLIRNTHHYDTKMRLYFIAMNKRKNNMNSFDNYAKYYYKELSQVDELKRTFLINLILKDFRTVYLIDRNNKKSPLGYIDYFTMQNFILGVIYRSYHDN